jgi:hypothetical protein
LQGDREALWSSARRPGNRRARCRLRALVPQ